MYMSPEQIQAMAIDRRSDIYSLGAVLYFPFTGVEPSEASRPPHRIDPTLPRPLSEAIVRALAPDRELRFQSAGDLAALLSHSLESAA